MALPLKSDGQEFIAAEFNEIRSWFRALYSADVRNFGAVGDGIQDDTAAIQAAIDSLSVKSGSGGTAIRGAVFFPAGVYKITATITFRSGTMLFGVGQASKIVAAGLSTALFRSATSATEAIWRSGLRDLYIDNTTNTVGSIGVDMTGMNEGFLENILIENVAIGVDLGTSTPTMGTFYNYLTDVRVQFATTGFRTAGIASETWIFAGRANSVTNGVILGSGSGASHVVAMAVESFTGTGFQINASSQTLVSPRMENLVLQGTGVSVAAGVTNAVVIRPALGLIATPWSDLSTDGLVVVDSTYSSPHLRLRKLRFFAGAPDSSEHGFLRTASNQRLDYRNPADTAYLPMRALNFLPGATGDDLGSSALQWRVFHREVVTGNLPAAGAAMNGAIIIEDAGVGDRNIIIYAGGQRFRIDGGVAF